MNLSGKGVGYPHVRQSRIGCSRNTAVRRILATSLLASILFAHQIAAAHESRPALLEITETSDQNFDILWKVPVSGRNHLQLVPVYPKHCGDLTHYQTWKNATTFVQRSRLHCSDKGLRGGSISISGLTMTVADVLLRIDTLDRGSVSTILHSGQPDYVLPERLGTGLMIASYFKLGAQHIFSGADHLLFVAGLLLLVNGLRPLLITITCFTVAHSLSLAMAVLGAVPKPTSIVEALIALSIVFLALEILRQKRQLKSDSVQRAYFLALFFGLLHGMGFASGLLSIGLPVGESLVALFFFNVGVEIGQLLFLATILGCYGLIRKSSYLVQVQWAAPVSYVMGSIGVFWLIQRMAFVN